MEVKLIALICSTILLNVLTTLPAMPKVAINKRSAAQQLQGFVQTPIGGALHTSDLRRPTFAELGMKQIQVTQQQLQFPWHGVIFYAAYQQVQPKNSLKLKTALLSYGQLFPQNTLFNTAIKFDCYRFGFTLPVILANKFQFAPQFEIDLLAFDYRMNTQQQQKRRHYHHLTVRHGFMLNYPIGADFSLHYQRLQTPSLLSVLNIKSEAVGFVVHALGKMILEEQQKIEFKDGQALPNHLLLKTKARVVESATHSLL